MTPDKVGPYLTQCPLGVESVHVKYSVIHTSAVLKPGYILT